MARFQTATQGLSLSLILVIVAYTGQARADDTKILDAPTAADFIRALTPPGAGPDALTRGNVVIGSTRSIGRRPSVNFKVQFEFGSDRLTEEAKQVLSELGLAITSQDLLEYSFLIAGHTDAVGSEEYNLLLSERRARAVREYLTSTVDVSAERLQDVGWGEARPLDASNPDGDTNRRVEITNIGGR